MATRLDRLVTLLDSGATPSVRSTAARQIGRVQKQHPQELFHMLGRVYALVGSRSWDTRVAAAQAFEAIAKEVAEWDPDASEADVKPPLDEDEELLTFAQFNVDSVIRHGRLLLGSAGKEYDDERLEGLGTQERVALQRAQIKKRLGIGAHFMDDDILDDVDLEGADAKPPPSKRRKQEPAESPSSTATPDEEVAEIDMSKLSARERNQIKRKARLESKKKKKTKVDLGPRRSAEGSKAAAPMTCGVDVTEQPGGQAIVVEAKKPEGREALFAISEGSWPFESIIEVLCIDLFDPSWEVRHGAGMALRDIFKYHGYGAGRIAGAGSQANNQRNQRFLEDVCVRLLCVFTLDRFGDFVADHVVAPVRETCAQALGVVSQFLTQPLLVATQGALLQLIERGTSSRSSGGSEPMRGIWEARHSGLSGLRYIVAVRRDMAGLLVAGTLDAALAGLRDHDDDVRSVSAETLLPLVDTLVTCQPTRILDVIDGVWTALTDLGDDLTASVASVMELLARLFSQPQVRAAVVDAGRQCPEKYAFAVLIPRLYPFFRHTIVDVRRAVLQTLMTFASMQADGLVTSNGSTTETELPAWVDTACLRLVLQNLVLETNDDILELSASLWLALLRQCHGQVQRQGDGYVLGLLPEGIVKAMFQLATTPIGMPLQRALIFDPRSDSDSGRYNVDAAMMQQDMGLISRETITRCRVHAGAALGLLVSAWPPHVREQTFGGLIEAALSSRLSLQCLIASVMIEEFVVAERGHVFASPGSGSPAATAAMARLMLEDFVPPELATRLLTPLSEALARDNSFSDLQPALQQVHADCRLLLESFKTEGKLTTGIPELPLLSSGELAPDVGRRISDQVFADLLSQIAPRVLTARVRSVLQERQQRLLASVEYYELLQQQLDVSVNAAMAGAVIAIGQLPAKLNNVLRSVMAAIKLESSELLQTRAACSVSRMAALCYCVEQPPRTGPADKMVRNLAALVCSDPWTTPVFVQRTSQTESILMLEMIQREQAARELHHHQQQQQQQQKKTAASKTNGDAQMAAAASASAQASQRKRRGKAAKGAKANEAEEAIPLVQAATLTEEQEKEQAARLIVRGAEAALTAIAQQFGPGLIATVPKLWEYIAEPLASVYGSDDVGAEPTACDSETLEAADRLFAASPDRAQTVIDALRVLLTLAPAADVALQPELVRSLHWVVGALGSTYSAVRHMAARTIAGLCRVATVPAMQMFVQTMLPVLGHVQAHRRQGVAEAIYYIIQQLGENVLPYVTFLIVPVLGRMSDPNEQTRLVCTNCFAQLLKLVPLEADIPDPPGISAELVAKREHERHFLAQLMDSSKLEPFRIPVSVNATLRKYQQEGVDWLAFLNKYELHGILCDDMGLGKTLQTICIVASDHYLRNERFAQAQAADSQPLPTLVVCPPTLIGHWEQEIKGYVGNLRPLAYAGTPAERRPLIPDIAANAADVVIMSYDVVRNDIELLVGQDWNYCVLDEGHCIKNAKTKLTQAVKRIRARHRLILSGTPVQNNVIELWSLFDFLMPGFLGTERQFNELYTKPILASRDAKQATVAHAGGETALKALHKQVLPFLLRRMKEDVLQDLPPKIIQDYYCELSPLQTFLYREFSKTAVSGTLKKSLGMQTADGAAETADEARAEEPEKKKKGTHVFQALQYLRKLCNHPALVLSPKHPLYAQVMADLQARKADLHSLDIAPKMQALKELLNECGIGMAEPEHGTTAMQLKDSDPDAASANHRVLIFCQHKEMIERIEQDLFQRAMPSVSYMRVDGTVEARRRQEIVTRFNADPSIDCLLLTTHVGGLGLNLTGADTVIFVEHDYNPAMDLQAMDRAHRLGQTRVVNVYRLITRNTLEEKIMGLQGFKMHMANTIVNQQNAGLQSMNTDQLLDLFDVSPPAEAQQQQQQRKKQQQGQENGGSITKALEGLEELWDASQYEEEYNLDSFISSLQQ
ncbi:TATA-binding protein-associated factor mot1 [Coemansia sp. RSA 552]|nr:TATA-binding protein-associated factor mot1 [Coemansia sp. RSA 552]